ncbi:hypothetical protein P692DRAFT_201661721, partial [Suillus brevipes Sb2]
IPKEYVDWYKRRLDNRTTHLHFNNYQSNLFNVSDGLDQGCPLSPTGFIFYNALVLPSKGELSLGFIDNVALIARGRSY